MHAPPIPREMTTVDFIGRLPLTKGCCTQILVFCDYLTRLVAAFVARDKKAETTSKIFVEEIIAHYSVSRKLLTGRGTDFE